MNTHRNPSVLALALAALGCSSGISLGSNDDSTMQGSGGGQGDGSSTVCPSQEEWVDLIQGERTINPGDELIDCVEEVVPDALLVKGLRLTNTKLYQSRLSDDHALCHTGPVDVHGHGARFVMNSRAATDVVRLPEGHALRITGSPLNLLLHLIDVTPVVLTGRSIAEVLLADPSQVTTEVSRLSPEVEQELSAAPLAGAGDPGCDEQWTALIGGVWTLQPRTQAFYCVRKTIAADLDVRALRASNPVGTGGAVLGIGAPSGPDGVARCAGSPPPLQTMLAATVGTREVSFPSGSAMQLVAGQQLVLQLDVFNDTDTVLTGESSIEIR